MDITHTIRLSSVSQQTHLVRLCVEMPSKEGLTRAPYLGAVCVCWERLEETKRDVS